MAGRGGRRGRVTREMFEEVVREAMEEFDLGRAEAEAEAEEQLRLSGFSDFRLVKARGMEGVERVMQWLEEGGKLEEWGTVKEIFGDGGGCGRGRQKEGDGLADGDGDGDGDGDDEIEEGLVKEVGRKGGMRILVRRLKEETGSGEKSEQSEKDWWERVEIWGDVVRMLSGGCRKNRVIFWKESGVKWLKVILEKLAGKCGEVGSAVWWVGSNVVKGVFRACGAVLKSVEGIKQEFSSGNTLSAVMRVGKRYRSDESVVRATCSLLKVLLMSDDESVVATEVFNRARVLAGHGGATQSGLRSLDRSEDVPNVIDFLWGALCSPRDGVTVGYEKPESDTVVDCLSLLRFCAVSNEICRDIVAKGFFKVTECVLQTRAEDAAVMITTFGLLRNLSARDECKSDVHDMVPQLTRAMAKHAEHAALVEQFCGVVSSVCLRRPDLARSLMEGRVLDYIVEAMEDHADEVTVQKAACLALRNAVARDDQVRRHIRDSTQAEKRLREARAKYPQACRDVAYSALRDMDVLDKTDIAGNFS